MKKILILLIVSLLAAPALADSTDTDREKDRKFFRFGDSNTKDLDNTGDPRNCKSPKQPEFIKNLSNEERLIIYKIYSNLISKPIIEQHKCTCAMLYPSYDETLNIFEKEFVPLGLPTRNGTLNSDYTRNFINDETYPYAKAVNICISLGVS